jgi:hypothetical protein
MDPHWSLWLLPNRFDVNQDPSAMRLTFLRLDSQKRFDSVQVAPGAAQPGFAAQ